MAYISFLAINQICLSNWQLGASLVAVGLSVWQAMIAIIIGKIITAQVAVFNGYIGAEWHIGFPVFSRLVWGIKGQYLALIQRLILSLVWFAVQSWTGGLCVQNILASIFPSYQNMANHFPASANMDTKQFIGWVLFNVLMVPILYIPPERMKKVVLYMDVVSVITLICTMIWALSAAHRGGPLLSQPATVRSGKELGWSIVLGVTTVIGSIAVGLTNQPDYSRFARRRGDQVFRPILLDHLLRHHHAPLRLPRLLRNPRRLRRSHLEPSQHRPTLARHRLQRQIPCRCLLLDSRMGKPNSWICARGEPEDHVPMGCSYLYCLAYPLGFAISLLVHWALNVAFPPPGVGEVDPVDCYGTFTPDEATRLGVTPLEESEREYLRVGVQGRM